MPTPPPDLEAVRRAVEDCSAGEDPGRKRDPRARLARWGNAAVPHLRRLAMETGNDRRQGFGLVSGLLCIPTQDGADLLVEILEGKTGVEARLALKGAHSNVSGWSRHVVRHPRFRQVLLHFLGGSWYEQGIVASTAAACGWQDLVPRVRKMLEHEKLSLREEAAKALRTLTGEGVRARRPELSFPREELCEDLLQEADRHAVGRRGGPRVARLPLAVPGRAPLIVTLNYGRGGRHAGHAVACDALGVETWEWTPPRNRITSAAVLRDERGDYGVALGPGGRVSIVAVGPTGDVLWEVTEKHVLYELHAHPRLPGWLLHVGGECALLRHDATGAREVDGADFGADDRGLCAYAVSGALFPGGDGTPSWVVVGHGTEPSVVRYDSDPARRWKARLSGRPGGLALVERGDARLFVAPTAAGDLVAFDEDGTLRWRGRLPGSQEDDTLSLYGVETVEPAEGRTQVLVHLLDGTQAYDVAF